MTSQALEITNVEFSYQIKYSSTHLKWLHFFNNITNVDPRLIFIYANRIVVIVSSDDLEICKSKWDYFRKKKHIDKDLHVRIIAESLKIKGLITNWFQNIKYIEVLINKDEIILKTAKNLRQFIIGKSGFELRMLENFINKCIILNDSDKTQNSFRCSVI